MRSIFIIVTASNRFGVLEYGKVLFLFFFDVGIATRHPLRGKVVRHPSPTLQRQSGDACPTTEELITKTRTLKCPSSPITGRWMNR